MLFLGLKSEKNINFVSLLILNQFRDISKNTDLRQFVLSNWLLTEVRKWQKKRKNNKVAKMTT